MNTFNKSQPIAYQLEEFLDSLEQEEAAYQETSRTLP
jgi:hypothetical protein